MSLKQLSIRFIPTLLAFPIGGEITVLTVGGIDSTSKALMGGAIVGLVIGLLQFVALRKFGITSQWIWSSALALSLSSFVVAATLGFGTTTSDLAVKGLFMGLAVGFAQALSQRNQLAGRVTWTLGTALTWALAWSITSVVIVDAESQYAIFGSSGALVATVLLTFLIPKSFQVESK